MDMIGAFNACLLMGGFIILCEVCAMFSKSGSDVFSALIKFVFYTFLAIAIYALASKAQYKTNNPNDYLSLLTFALALFEAIPNLFFLLRIFISWFIKIRYDFDFSKHKFKNLDLEDKDLILKKHHIELEYLKEKLKIYEMELQKLKEK